LFPKVSKSIEKLIAEGKAEKEGSYESLQGMPPDKSKKQRKSRANKL